MPLFQRHGLAPRDFSVNPFQYKFLTFLVVLNVTVAICHLLFTNKLTIISSSIISAGSIPIPFWTMLDDIIAEVYGFAISLRIYCSTMLMLFFLSVIIFIIIKIPTPISWNRINFYNQIFKFPVFQIGYALIISVIAYRINAYLLIKWKILLKGKYFWLRSINSSLISDIVFLSLILPMWTIAGPATSVKEAIHLTAISLVFRIIFYVILAVPSNFIVNILKMVEKISACDTQVNFNPFKKQNIEETKIYEPHVI